MDDIRLGGKDVHNENPGEKLNYHGVLNDTANRWKGANFGYPSCIAAWDTQLLGVSTLSVGSLFSPRRRAQGQRLRLAHARAPALPLAHGSARHQVRARRLRRLRHLPRQLGPHSSRRLPPHEGRLRQGRPARRRRQQPHRRRLPLWRTPTPARARPAASAPSASPSIRRIAFTCRATPPARSTSLPASDWRAEHKLFFWCLLSLLAAHFPFRVSICIEPQLLVPMCMSQAS